MELVRGSHKWNLCSPDGEFHGPSDYQAAMRRAAAKENKDPEIVSIVVRAGGGSLITAGLGMGRDSTHRTDRGGPWLSTQSRQMRSLCARKSISETGRSMGAI